MKNIIIILLAGGLLACSGGREAVADPGARATPNPDPYAEARALYEAREEVRRRAGDAS